MDVTIQIDELVVGNDGPDHDDALTAPLRRALGGVLDGETVTAIGRAVTGTVSGADPEYSSSQGSA